MRTLTFVFVSMLVCATATSGTTELAARLARAHSLRCTFSLSSTIWVRSGRRTAETTAEKGEVVYDSIDTAKGTARIIGNIGASNLVAWREASSGSLWLREMTPSGNEVTTTIFPMYVEGGDEFVVIESRHSMVGQTVLGEEASGSCRVLE